MTYTYCTNRIHISISGGDLHVRHICTCTCICTMAFPLLRYLSSQADVGNRILNDNPFHKYLHTCCVMLSNLCVFSSASFASLSASLLSSVRLGHLHRTIQITHIHLHTCVCHWLEYSPPLLTTTQSLCERLSANLLYSFMMYMYVRATKRYSLDPHCSHMYWQTTCTTWLGNLYGFIAYISQTTKSSYFSITF